MKVQIDDIEVIFPYNYVYPEQYEYMKSLYQGIVDGGHLLLEMPSGCGKTIALFALLLAYQAHKEDAPKLIYCTRTVVEMEKALEELRRLIAYRESVTQEKSTVVGIGLSARKNLCCNPRAYTKGTGQEVDAACRSLTATWVTPPAERPDEGPAAEPEPEPELEAGGSAEPPPLPDIEDLSKTVRKTKCTFFNKWENSTKPPLEPGIYTMAELKELCTAEGYCPYFASRTAVAYADVVVFNYSYMIDPKISQIIGPQLAKNSVVVFDEAHNIDNVCIEVLSVNLSHNTVRGAAENIKELGKRYEKIKQEDMGRINDEYTRLVEQLTSEGVADVDLLPGPAADTVSSESLPGDMRKIGPFLQRMTDLKNWMESSYFSRSRNNQMIHRPMEVLGSLKSILKIDETSLKFIADRLSSLMNTLKIMNLHDFRHVLRFGDFLTVLGARAAQANTGFAVVYEPYDERFPYLDDKRIQLACLDASLALKPVFDKFHSVVLTSGTLTPRSIYEKLLNFQPRVSKSFQNTLPRKCIRPLVISKGADQVPLTSRFENRSSKSVIRNYGHLILDLAQIVPDGMICFFTSYLYMEEVVSQWHDLGILTDLTKHKLIFIETQSVAETSTALHNYRIACDIGRGAVFFSIARGKVAEGIDFDGHYGRCVVICGVPYVYTEDVVLKERLKWLKERLQIDDSEYLAFDALRHASQCIGRVLRNKSDYGLMILADQRYNQQEKRSKLPEWIRQQQEQQFLNLGVDVALSLCKQFLREMAQPWERAKHMGTSLLSEEDIRAKQTGRKIPRVILSDEGAPAVKAKRTKLESEP